MIIIIMAIHREVLVLHVTLSIIMMCQRVSFRVGVVHYTIGHTIIVLHEVLTVSVNNSLYSVLPLIVPLPER